MKGQWLGKYTGDVDGDIMINIDEMHDYYAGVAYVMPYDKSIPSTIAYIATDDKSQEQSTKALLNPVHPTSGYQVEWEKIKDLFPEGTEHSNEAEITLIESQNSLSIKAITDIGIEFQSTLTKTPEDSHSMVKGEMLDWETYKKRVSKLSKSDYLFRGQEETWRLRTSFHRNGRYRINTFISEDVKKLHRALSSKTSHFFNLEIPDQNGAFYNLLQHHGYPTPLLDWSHSPYVAAFFAFKDLPKNPKKGQCVRIYLFNNKDWYYTYPQIQNLDPPFPHLSVMEFIAIDNDRLIPQQSITTVTNIDNIEEYILRCEESTGTTFIQAFDIPVKEREKVMDELRYMGITAGSMFPGIDGICQQHKEVNFD